MGAEGNGRGGGELVSWGCHWQGREGEAARAEGLTQDER